MLKYMAFENIVRKGENASHQHFLLFPPMFSSPPKPKKKKILILAAFSCLSAICNALNLVKSRKLAFGDGLVLFADTLNLLTVQGSFTIIGGFHKKKC